MPLLALVFYDLAPVNPHAGPRRAFASMCCETRLPPGFTNKLRRRQRIFGELQTRVGILPLRSMDTSLFTRVTGLSLLQRYGVGNGKPRQRSRAFNEPRDSEVRSRRVMRSCSKFPRRLVSARLVGIPRQGITPSRRVVSRSSFFKKNSKKKHTRSPPTSTNILAR